MLNENAQTEFTKTMSGRDVAQAGALCYRWNENGGVEILFVGSRRNGRWGIPKGQPGLRMLLSQLESVGV